MSYVNTIKMLKTARSGGYAIGAYNIFNLESLQAAINAAKRTSCPIILQASESAIRYAGANNLVSLAKNASKELNVDVALHLDHGKSVEMCKQMIDAGFSSVMIDLSGLPFDENVAKTKQVVKYAHKKGVSVEAELGEIKGTEDNQTSQASHLTDPKKAIEFIKLTGVDSLAVSIGTAHGINKGSLTPKIHYEILDELEKLLPPDYPLVCHGASSVNDDIINEFIGSGGTIKKAQGISLEDIKKMATATPISKINIDTDLRLAFTSALRKSLIDNSADFNPRTHLKAGLKRVEEQIIFMNTQILR